MQEKEKIISVYFTDESPDDFAELEVQVNEDTADSIMDRLENHNEDKLFRLALNKLINLQHVKYIKVEDVPDEDEECGYEDNEA